MTHAQFVAEYHAGRIRVSIDRAAAARLVSERLLLPWHVSQRARHERSAERV